MNRQTKYLRKSNISSKAARGGGATEPHFHEFPAGSQPSRRKTKWGQKLPGQGQGARIIIYPEEFKNRGIRK